MRTRARIYQMWPVVSVPLEPRISCITDVHTLS